MLKKKKKVGSREYIRTEVWKFYWLRNFINAVDRMIERVEEFRNLANRGGIHVPRLFHRNRPRPIVNSRRTRNGRKGFPYPRQHFCSLDYLRFPSRVPEKSAAGTASFFSFSFSLHLLFLSPSLSFDNDTRARARAHSG